MSGSRLSISAYARHRGVSRQAVHLAIRTGRIRRCADGKIDPVVADREWLANTAPTLRWAGSKDVVLTAADLERLLG